MINSCAIGKSLHHSKLMLREAEMRGFIGGGKEIKENRVCHLIRLCSSSALAVNKSSIKRDPKFNHACPNHSRKKKKSYHLKH
jgi:hypothetical protein